MHEFYKIVLNFNGFLLSNSLFLFLFSPSLFLFSFSFFFHPFSFFFPFSIHKLTKSLIFFGGGKKYQKIFLGGQCPLLPPLGDATDLGDNAWSGFLFHLILTMNGFYYFFIHFLFFVVWFHTSLRWGNNDWYSFNLYFFRGFFSLFFKFYL